MFHRKFGHFPWFSKYRVLSLLTLTEDGLLCFEYCNSENLVHPDSKKIQYMDNLHTFLGYCDVQNSVDILTCSLETSICGHSLKLEFPENS